MKIRQLGVEGTDMNSNWKKQTLGDVCIVERGSSPRPIKQYLTDSPDGVNWIKIGDTKNIDKYILTTKQKITKEGAEKSRRVEPGDLILSNSMSFGKPYVMATSGYVHDGWFILRLSKNIDTDFFHYLLSSDLVQFQFTFLAAGSVVKNISKDLVKRAVLPIPPFAEQKRIVAILDEVFEGIDVAIANTEKNLTNARELFESHLNTIFTCKGEDWLEIELGTCLETLTDYHANGSYKVLKQNVELLDNQGYAHMVRSTDFEHNFKNPLKYIDEHAYNFLKKSKIFGGELIISKIGNAGKIYLMPKPNMPSSLAMNLFLVRTDQNKLKSDYLYLFLRSNFGKHQISERLNGTTTKTIRKDGIRSIIVWLPSIEEQSMIVDKVFSVADIAQDLEAIYQQKLAALNELKQSILQKAFSGELTTDIANQAAKAAQEVKAA